MACCSSLAPAQAEDALEITITVKNHAFDPAQIEVPAGKPVVLRIKNLDASPMEFESKSPATARPSSTFGRRSPAATNSLTISMRPRPRASSS
jgi:hypothetical protein